MKRVSLLSISLILLSSCARLASIPYHPQQTPESWLQIQPFVVMNVGAVDFILVQPSSTVFVYMLGLITVGVGYYFFQIQNNFQSRKWWGIALLLWGFGALFAGTSYQAFSYEIKCAGQASCSWTSWWEIIYLLLSAASIDAMLISGSFSSCQGKCRKALKNYAILNITVYSILVIIGAFTLNKFLISFEFLLIVTAPTILTLFVLNGWRYFKFGARKDFVLWITWIWLGVVIGAYFTYLILGISDNLWDQGIWFSENDILHIGLVSWMVYIASHMAKQITDEGGENSSAAGELIR